jgi:hypothetical protein
MYRLRSGLGVWALKGRGTDETPRMRFIFPGSTKLRVFACLTTGHRN